MLFLVWIKGVPASRSEECERQHTKFISELSERQSLLLEASVDDSGSLLVLDVPSMEDAVDLLQGDSLVVLSSEVLIRPLVLNLVREGLSSGLDGKGMPAWRLPGKGRKRKQAETKGGADRPRRRLDPLRP